MIGMLIQIIFAGLIIAVAYWLLGLLAIPYQVRNVLLAIIAVVVILFLFQTLGTYTV